MFEVWRVQNCGPRFGGGRAAGDIAQLRLGPWKEHSSSPTSGASLSVAQAEIPPSPCFILAGFVLEFELKIFTKHYPRTLQYFTAWTDIQEHVKDESNLTSPRAKPGQMACLTALGFENETWAVNPRSHRAGNDIARALLIMLHLLARTKDAPELVIMKSPGPSACQRRYVRSGKNGIFHKRPCPEDEYPFLVKISIGGAMAGRTAVGTLYRFAEYKPTAVGLPKQKDKPKSAWVCLPSLEDAKRFVREVKGLAEQDGQGWDAALDVSPEVETRTKEEWDEIRRMKKANKEASDILLREERQKKTAGAEMRETTLLDAEEGADIFAASEY